MTERIPDAVLWCLAVGLLALAVLLVRQRGISARQRRRNEELADGLRTREEELRHLITVRLPALEESAGRSVPGVGLLDNRLAETEFAKCLDGVLARFTEAVENAQARADRSAKAALKSSMRSIQALANEQQVAISEMQDRHDHPDVLRDLLEVDHANAQFGRRAQAIAVLCGSWPGRQRTASGLVEVVRGATSRIRDYRRIRIRGEVDIAVESRAVEPVVLAVAELLDNAARHSQPTTQVEVGVQAVHNGACIVIDDAGVGMDAQASEKASVLLSGRRTVDVTRLEDPPQFGFAVIGVLAHRYGFGVRVDTQSPYGGVRAVVFLPSVLLTRPEDSDGLPTASVAAARGASGPARAPEPAAPAATTAGGLPKRRRRAAQHPATAQRAPDPAEEADTRSAEETARRIGAFARGTLHGRATQAADHEDEGDDRG
ncbi:ATP-binding protein [Streptomyces sp. WMMC940]|uniref:ATP-binding protein n=1 Tax=Streptomyces sp. WMMC940 TaxID=3015153 RepID=UPI0022B60204|nr:ATP-binding protein [Streptomyces sp. WMMC940]MCZ7456450.1 ATP-binding protein [Streptomyces sp. WMMC940]